VPVVEARDRRVAAHPAGVRPLVAVADPLVVLRRRERDGTLAVAERQERDLFAVEELLDDDLRRAEAAVVEEHRECSARLDLALADDHALARREHVRLEDDRVGARDEVALALHAAPEDDMACRRNAHVLHQLLRERLGALEVRGRGSRAEPGDAGLSQRVDHARHERGLRTDHDEVAPLVGGEAHDGIDVLDRDVHAPNPITRDARVPGRREHLGVLRAAQERAHDRVLATAAAEDEDLSTGAQSCAMNSSTGIAVSDS
jgi:hypothetical protein